MIGCFFDSFGLIVRMLNYHMLELIGAPVHPVTATSARKLIVPASIGVRNPVFFRTRPTHLLRFAVLTFLTGFLFAWLRRTVTH